MNPNVTKAAANVKRFFKKDRLAVRNDFKINASLYRKSKEDAPIMSCNFGGDYKIDILKLGIVVFFGMLAVIGFCAALRLIFTRRK